MARGNRGNPSPNPATRFQPGRAWKGNPGGKAKASDGIRDLARQHSPEAVMALVRALSDPKQCVHAAIALLDRGLGKPRQEVQATVHSLQGGIDAPEQDLSKPEDLEAWLERRRRELAQLKRPN